MWLPLLQVIFITEYMSSGSLKQFLKKTKKNHKTMNEKVTADCRHGLRYRIPILKKQTKLFHKRKWQPLNRTVGLKKEKGISKPLKTLERTGSDPSVW